MPQVVGRAVDAAKRRRFERAFRKLPVENGVRLERLGSDWGGWTIPVEELGHRPVCYCAGAGGDVSFDLELLRRYDATVRCIDPSAVFGEAAQQAAGHAPTFAFRQAALASADGSIEMFVSSDPLSSTASSENIYRTNRRFVVEACSLTTLMADWGDDHIDLLKLDIEGSEYEVLESVSPTVLGVRVLCIEFHHTSSSSRALRILEALRPDYRIVHRSQRSDVTLLRR